MKPAVRPLRGVAAMGAVLAATAVALAAYASHAATPEDRVRLFLSAAFAFGHGATLAVAAMHCARRIERMALVALLVGTLLFAGSLAAGVLVDGSTRLAPVGGVLLIVGWIGLAIERMRR